MSFYKTLRRASVAIALGLAVLPSFAGENTITIQDAYARASTPSAKSGAAFLEITNTGSDPDRVISVASPVARVVQLHTHRESDEGVMRMIHVEEGFEIAPGETLKLARGGKHVMFMGLSQQFNDGDTLPLTLTFEKAGDVTIQIPVDSSRKPSAHGNGNGKKHGHDASK